MSDHPNGSATAGCVPRREDDVLAPLGGYARTKVALEAICARRAAAGGVVAVARPFTVAGEGQRSDMALSQWLDDAARGRPVPRAGIARALPRRHRCARRRARAAHARRPW